MFLEADMLKTILVVAATAVLVFGAGVRTRSTVAPSRSVEANGALHPRQQFPRTKMHPKVKPDDLPVEYLPLLAGGYGFRL
jgi:hypothetical protein